MKARSWSGSRCGRAPAGGRRSSPSENDGYLFGVTDDRVRSLRFTTTKGTVRVPVSRQAFVLWTTDAFRDLKRYDALGDGNRVLVSNAQCNESGCA